MDLGEAGVRLHPPLIPSAGVEGQGGTQLLIGVVGPDVRPHSFSLVLSISVLVRLAAAMVVAGLVRAGYGECDADCRRVALVLTVGCNDFGSPHSSC